MSAPVCPTCVVPPDKIWSMGAMSTCMGYNNYYDSEGNYHSHDPNRHEYNWRCSNGHTWSVSRYNPCGVCDYNKV